MSYAGPVILSWVGVNIHAGHVLSSWHTMLTTHAAHAPTPPTPKPPSDVAQPSVAELASSMLQVYRSLKPPVSLGELVFGLQLLARQHAERGPSAADVLTGAPVTDVALLHELIDDVDLARACYCPSAQEAAARSRIKVQDIVAWVGESSYLRPGYWVGVDHRLRQVVWAVRGTKHVRDLLIDLSSEHPYMAGHTHWGMHNAAVWMLRREGHRVAELLRTHPGYNLHLVGHSLGGGVVSLVAHMLHNDPASAALVLPPGMPAAGRVTATAIAPPCVMERGMALSCRPYVTSLILGCDLVPRLNGATLATLRAELAQVDWVAGVQGRLAEHSLVQGVVSAVGLTTSTLQPAAGDALRRVVEALEALHIRQLSQSDSFAWVLSQLRLSQLSQQDTVKSAQALVSDAYGTLVRLLASTPARPALTDGRNGSSDGSSSNGSGISNSDGNGAHNGTRGAGAATGGHVSASASLQGQDQTSGSSTAAGQGHADSAHPPGNAVSVRRSQEPDLAPSANLLSDVSSRVEALLQAAPPELRDACLRLLGAVRTADLVLPDAWQWPPPDWQRLLGSFRRGSSGGSGKRAAARAERSGQSGSASENGDRPREGDPEAPSHVLHPAGRLFYITREVGTSTGSSTPGSSGSLGSGSTTSSTSGSTSGSTSDSTGIVHTVLEVPPGAQYFQHALLISQAMRDHRSRAYRNGLLDAVHRASRIEECKH